MNSFEEEKPPVFATWTGWYRLVLLVFIVLVALMAYITHWMA